MRALAALAAAATLALAAGLAAAVISPPSGVLLETLVLPVDLTNDSPRAVTDQLIASTIAMRDRALASDDLAPATADAAPAVRIDAATGPLDNLLRAFRRGLGRDGVRIAVEIVRLPDHLEIVFRERPSHAALRSRVPRGPGALERLVAEGSEDLLLLTAPLEAATLVTQDPRALGDAVRLDEVLTMLARDPAATRDPRALLVRSIYDAANGRCREALAGYDRVIAALPSAPRAYVLAADCHARLGERDRALERLMHASRQAGDAPLALSLAGQAYRRIGQPEQGLALLRVAHARDPRLPGTAIAIGEALLALHRPAEALAWLEANPPPNGMRGRWLAALGVAQVRTGAGPSAEATAAALRALDPAGSEGTRIEAELASAMKAWPQALGRFGALRVIAPADGTARAGEGQALLGMRRYADAIDAYRACAEVSPWLAECRLGLGIALREADKPEEALIALADAAKLDSLDPRIPFETSKTLRALLRRDEAATYAGRAESLAHRLGQRLSLP